MFDTFRFSEFGILTLVIALAFAGGCAGTDGAALQVPVDDDDIGGVVTSSNGPEAGVRIVGPRRASIRNRAAVVGDQCYSGRIFSGNILTDSKSKCQRADWIGKIHGKVNRN